MKSPRSRKSGPTTRNDYRRLPLISALVAAGGSLTALPAHALELGEVSVESKLGQPLRASIAYALAPNEALASTCVSLQPATAGDALPTLGRATLAVADGRISITGDTAIREPLMSMRLNVRCPYTPQLSRDYMLFFDPAQPLTAARVAVAPVAAQQAAAQPVSRPASATTAAPRPRRQQNLAPIEGSDRYRVQPGDSLSQIAQRIENRPVGLWEAVGAIFDANPGAFIDDDPNRLKAGAWLVIPDFADSQAPITAQADLFPAPDNTATGAATPAAVSQAAAAPAAPAASAEPSATVPAVEPPAELAENTQRPATDARVALGELRPGDVIPVSDNPYVAVPAAEIVIPDTQVGAPVASSTSPNAPVAVARPSAAEPESSNLVWWLTGIGLSVVAGLLLLSGAVRRRFGSTPIAPAISPQRRRTDGDTERVEAVTDLDFGLEDDSPTHENLALDADLVVGTGLSEGTDVDLAQDFGFAKTTALDMELPEEMSSGFYEAPATDIIPPFNMEAPDSILESEILPDDDEYDMSVIMDATKMPQPEDVTERDLEAIEVGTTDEPLLDEDYTLNQEPDFAVLEQDYEDELTATQALNQEIARAAAELAERLDDDVADDETSEMSLASVTALDITAQLPATNDDSSDPDTTGITEEMTLSLEADDKTAEMPAADSDKTAEMPARKRGTK